MASALLLAVVVGVLAVVLPSVFAKGDEVDEVLESDTRIVERRRSTRSTRVDRWSRAASRALGSGDLDDEDDTVREEVRYRSAVDGGAPAEHAEQVHTSDVRGRETVRVDLDGDAVVHEQHAADTYADTYEDFWGEDDVREHRPLSARLDGVRALGSGVSRSLLTRRARRTRRAAPVEVTGARRSRRLQRRRRALVGLLAATVGAALLGLAVPALLWVAGASFVGLVGFVSYLRREAQREARWRARSRRAGSVLQSRRDVADVRGAAPATAPAVGTDTWEPVPVPEPTYVRLAREAQQAELTSRTLLSWRAAEIDAALVDEDADPVAETVAMFDEVVERRRAVGEW